MLSYNDFKIYVTSKCYIYHNINEVQKVIAISSIVNIKKIWLGKLFGMDNRHSINK